MTGVRRSSKFAVVTLCWVVTGLACERAPTPKPRTPAPAAPAPTPEPAPAPEPEPAPIGEPVPDLELPEIAGLGYLEIVTGGADPNAELPMIVALHGNGAFPRLMAYALLDDPGTSEYPAARVELPARYIFLRGAEPVPVPGHARWFSITANEALASPTELAALAAQIDQRADEVAVAITALIAARPTRGKPILTGHSQGGILSFGLAVRHPALFAAVVPVSGWLPQPLWPTASADPAARALRIIAVHGAEDRVVSYDASMAGVEQLRALGYDVELRSFAGVGHNLAPMLADLRTILADQAGQPDQ